MIFKNKKVIICGSQPNVFSYAELEVLLIGFGSGVLTWQSCISLSLKIGLMVWGHHQEHEKPELMLTKQRKLGEMGNYN